MATLDLVEVAAAAAGKNFAAFSPSTRKHTLAWIASAKRPETRQKRIKEAVEKSARNEKPQP